MSYILEMHHSYQGRNIFPVVETFIHNRESKCKVKYSIFTVYRRNKWVGNIMRIYVCQRLYTCVHLLFLSQIIIYNVLYLSQLISEKYLQYPYLHCLTKMIIAPLICQMLLFCCYESLNNLLVTLCTPKALMWKCFQQINGILIHNPEATGSHHTTQNL